MNDMMTKTRFALIAALVSLAALAAEAQQISRRLNSMGRGMLSSGGGSRASVGLPRGGTGFGAGASAGAEASGCIQREQTVSTGAVERGTGELGDVVGDCLGTFYIAGGAKADVYHVFALGLGGECGVELDDPVHFGDTDAGGSGDLLHSLKRHIADLFLHVMEHNDDRSAFIPVRLYDSVYLGERGSVELFHIIPPKRLPRRTRRRYGKDY